MFVLFIHQTAAIDNTPTPVQTKRDKSNKNDKGMSRTFCRAEVISLFTKTGNIL